MFQQKRMHKGNEKLIRGVSLFSFWIGLISILVVTLIGVFMFTFIYIYKASLYQAASIHSEQSVSQVASTIGIYSNEMEQNIDYLTEAVKQMTREEEIDQCCQSLLRMQKNIVSIMFYRLDGTILRCYSNGLEWKEDQSRSLSYYPAMFEEGEGELSSPHVQNLFTGYYPWVATIGNRVSSSLFGEDIYLAMDVQASSILAYVDNVSIGQQGYCFVINQKGELVYHPKQQLIFSGIKEEPIDTLKNLEDGVYIQEDTIYGIKSADVNGWKVIGVSDTDEMVGQKIMQAMKAIGLSAIFCLLLAWIIVLIFSNRISKPIRQLMFDMQTFEKHAKDYQYAPIQGVQEVAMLSESFAHMVKMIQKLMEQVKREELTLRKAELKALQAQINPHFLYNTLDSIQWLCEQNKNEKAIEMVSALAKFFRISISKGRELISIENELLHAKNYLTIQAYRYSNAFSYEFIVDEAVLPFFCNKIILQPLIENAIIHGMDDAMEEGNIIIRAKDEKDYITLSVEDNGIGMTREEKEGILMRDIVREDGIGLKNVNDRIHIYFGCDYGISVESEMDEGTTIEIRIPKTSMEEARALDLE